jgi:tetratricopeptide (TPR) repeat protein
MAFEKAKVIKAAEKFLAQGKISAAIKEYRQIIEHDDADLTTLNMLGDLLARAGEKDEAVACFLRIAEHFREQEFRLKAIAMYRKIEKLKPRDPATAKELGALYAAQGLIADARTQYLVVADAYTRAGDNRQTLKVLHRIADLDPHNTEIRIKLAQGYFKEGMLVDAAKAYSEAANRLFESSQFEKSLAAYSKTLELHPHDMVALKGLVSAHAALGTADDAAELLEKAVADTPDDPELVSMLAQAYIEADDAAGAERATAILMSEDATNYRRYIEVALLYLKLGQEDEAARILGNIIEPMLAGREENDLLELVNDLLTRNPEHVAGLRLLARIHWWQRDMEKLRAVLERLAESAEAAGLVEDERYALTQLIRLAPDEQRYLDRLNTLGGVLEDIEGESMKGDPALEAVPSFEGFAIVGETEPGVLNAPAGGSSEFEWNSVAEESPARAEISFADLNETEVTTDGGLHGLASADPMFVDPFASEAESAEGAGPTATEQSVGRVEGAPSSVKALMQQELESVDFYLAQGYSDIAVDTLDLLERQFGSHPEIEARRERLKATQVEPRTESVESVSKPDAGAPLIKDSEVDIAFGDIEIQQSRSKDAIGPAEAPAVSAPLPVGSGIDSGLAEIFEEFRLEAEGESGASNEDYETHYNMATAYKEMDLLDEAIREFQTATGLTGSADGTTRYFQCCNMLGHCFVQKGMPQAAVIWFKKGLAAPGRSGEEYKALQYELGSAYEAMDDLTGAVAAFTEVYGVDVSYRDIADKLESLQARVATETKKGK